MTHRPRVLQSTTGAAPAQASDGDVNAPRYPSREVRIIVGFPHGGPLDIVARVIAPWLSRHFAQEFAVVNRPGASGNLATAMVAGATADGYTLLLCGPVNTINTTLFAGQLDFDFVRDIAPVACIARVPLVIEVHPSLPVRSLAELVAYAKSGRGKLKAGYAGSGTPQHIAIELFKLMSGTDIVLVPYPGSAAVLADLLRGRVQLMFDPLPSSLPHIRAGKLVPLAVTSPEPSAALPDVPAVHGFLRGYQAESWFGIGAPRGTPASIVDACNAAINAGLASAEVATQLFGLGAVAMPRTPAGFARFIDEETARYRQVIALTGIATSA